MKAAFISPYLDILGGGEKYLLDIAYCLHKHGIKTTFYWKNPKIKELIKERFGKNYDFINIDDTWFKLNTCQKLLRTKEFELIFYHPDGSYFFSLAKKNFALLQVPKKNLLNFNNELTKIKFHNWIPVYNSYFTKRFFEKQINKKGVVLYPTITYKKANFKKELIILSVGRFFKQLHSKKQEILIKAFQYAYQKYPEFKKYQLILAGSYKSEDQNYLDYLKKLINKNSNIALKTNLTDKQLYLLYQKASIYWHATGYGENEQKKPETMEHFGISVVEAMNCGAVPLAFKGGGPKETIIDQKTGFLYKSRDELIKKTYFLMKNPENLNEMSIKAMKRAEEKFGELAFSKRVSELIGKIP